MSPSPKQKPKATNNKKRVSSTSSPQTVQIDDENSQSSVRSTVAQRVRAKKYTKEECDALMMTCAEFHVIINRNSNSDADRKSKAKAWETVKHKFDLYCKSEGIYVSEIV